MKLSKLDRLILSHQHSILEKLDDREASFHATMRKVYERGYETNYDDDFQNIYDEFGREKSAFVLDVLSMHEAMQESWKQQGSPAEIDENLLAFRGFDGNNEVSYMAYARFVVKDEERFQGLAVSDFNSHMPSADAYRHMVDAWNSTSDPYRLSVQDIKNILEARRAG